MRNATALLTAELGSTFTEEGGSYIWVKLAPTRAKVAEVPLVDPTLTAGAAPLAP